MHGRLGPRNRANCQGSIRGNAAPTNLANSGSGEVRRTLFSHQFDKKWMKILVIVIGSVVIISLWTKLSRRSLLNLSRHGSGRGSAVTSCGEALIAYFLTHPSDHPYRIHNNLQQCNVSNFDLSKQTYDYGLNDEKYPINSAAMELHNAPLSENIEKWTPSWSTPDELASMLAKSYLEPFTRTAGGEKHRWSREELLLHKGPNCVKILEGMTIKIINQTLYLVPQNLEGALKEDFLVIRRYGVLRSILATIESYPEEFDGISLEMPICLSDESYDPPRPILSIVTGSDGVSASLPLNDPLRSIAADDDYKLPLDDIMKWRLDYPWNERIEKAVFRGGGNRAGVYPASRAGEMGEFETDPTYENMEKSYANYEISQHPGSRPSLYKQSEYRGKELLDVVLDPKGRDYLSLRNQEQYKMIINAAGNYGWADRLSILLKLGPAVIWQQSLGGMEWYYPLLKPWVHYLPVDHLWRNLPDVVAWGVAHDDAIRQISANADLIAKKVLDGPVPVMYLAKLLHGYSKLCDFEVELNDGDIAVTREFLTLSEQILVKHSVKSVRTEWDKVFEWRPVAEEFFALSKQILGPFW